MISLGSPYKQTKWLNFSKKSRNGCREFYEIDSVMSFPWNMTLEQLEILIN